MLQYHGHLRKNYFVSLTRVWNLISLLFFIDITMAGNFWYSLGPGMARILGFQSAFACVGGLQDAVFLGYVNIFWLEGLYISWSFWEAFCLKSLAFSLDIYSKPCLGHVRRKQIQGVNLHVLHLFAPKFLCYAEFSHYLESSCLLGCIEVSQCFTYILQKK